MGTWIAGTLLLLAGEALVFEVLEEAGRGGRPRVHSSRASRLTAILLYLVNNLGSLLLMGLLLGALRDMAAAPLATPRAALDGLPGPARLLLLLLLAELGAYLAHRAAHHVPWLWRFHALHHEPTSLDWLQAHRQHPVDFCFQTTAFNLPLALLAADPATWLLPVVVLRLHTVLIHADVPGRFGRLGSVIASPVFHRGHHAAASASRTVNFGGFLPLWDVIFGTARLDETREPARLGLL